MILADVLTTFFSLSVAWYMDDGQPRAARIPSNNRRDVAVHIRHLRRWYFPNQTNPDGLGPAAALHSDSSRARYNYELSWLSGQRLSACSCPGSDHPGLTVSRGRGAPEIDVFEAEKDKDVVDGHVVSQSAQFAPYSHDYVYYNDSGQWTNFDPTRTRANSYRGSAVQQSVSGLTRLPSDMFQGSGAKYKKFGM